MKPGAGGLNLTNRSGAGFGRPLGSVALAGVPAMLFYLLHDVVGATLYPGYDAFRQAVSDLTSADAPSRIVAGGLSNVYGTLAVLSSVAVAILMQQSDNARLRRGVGWFAVMNLVSNVGYALFPLSTSGYAGTFSDIMHLYVVTASVVLTSIASLVLIALGGRRGTRRDKLLGVLALVALAMMLGGAVLSNAGPASLFGLFERFSTYSAVTFTAVLGVYGHALSRRD